MTCFLLRMPWLRWNNSVFSEIRLLPTKHAKHIAEHAITVDAGSFRFIFLDIPCGKKIQNTECVLEWIPPHHEHVLIAGDWNKLTTNNECHALLQFRSLHCCPLPLDFTREAKNESTSLLDRAASTNAVVTQLLPWHLSDHLALIMKFCPEKPYFHKFPLNVLEDTLFQKRAKACT